MNAIPKGCRTALVVLAFLGLSSVTVGKSPRGTGGGGVALNPSVTSMFAAVDERPVSGKTPLTFMIYFRGKPGWHQREWSSKQQLYGKPFFIEFSCDLTTLRADYDDASRVLTVFGQKVNVRTASVVLVERVDHPGEEVVTPLGRFNLRIPDGANPAAWLLEHNDDLRARVLATTE